MEAPDKMFVPTRFRLVDALRVRENDTDEEYIRKDAILEWIEKELDKCVGNSSWQRFNALHDIIDKIESL